jgi:hypothetical protein
VRRRNPLSPEANRDTRFFLIAGTAGFGVVFAGFARTYYLKAWLVPTDSGGGLSPHWRAWQVIWLGLVGE